MMSVLCLVCCCIFQPQLPCTMPCTIRRCNRCYHFPLLPKKKILTSPNSQKLNKNLEISYLLYLLVKAQFSHPEIFFFLVKIALKYFVIYTPRVNRRRSAKFLGKACSSRSGTVSCSISCLSACHPPVVDFHGG